MRNFDEIVKELLEHPDFCCCEIWCWSAIVDGINENLSYETDDSNRLMTLDDLSKEQKVDIEERIKSIISDNYNYSDPIPAAHWNEDNTIELTW